MKYNKALQQIIADISSVYEAFLKGTKIYIGKSDDKDATIVRHEEKEGLNYTTFLATASPAIIAKLENDLISHFNKSGIPILNKIIGSPGNTEANMVYVCFDNYIPEEIDGEILLQLQYGEPIQIN